MRPTIVSFISPILQHEAGRNPLLTHADMSALAMEHQGGNPADDVRARLPRRLARLPAGEILLRCNLRLIEKITMSVLHVARYGRIRTEPADVFQCAMEGFVKALNDYDPDIGKLTSYVKYRVFSHAKYHLTSHRNVVKLPHDVQETCRLLRKAYDASDGPSPEQWSVTALSDNISAAENRTKRVGMKSIWLGLHHTEIPLCERASRRDRQQHAAYAIPFERPDDELLERSTYEDALPSGGQPADDLLHVLRTTHVVGRLIQRQLPRIEEFIILQRLRRNPPTFTEIAQMLAEQGFTARTLSKERVRQLEARGIARLRETLSSEGY